MARIIVITSGKGGVGKSTITINLGYALASSGNKVCLIDSDFGLKNLDVMMGLENRVIYDLRDVIEGRCTLSQILVKDKRRDSLYLLPACKSLSFDSMNIKYMRSLIENLQSQFDYILIDSPAGIEKGFQYACSLSKEAIIVVNLDVASLRDADRVIGLLLKNNVDTLHMIINKYNNDDVLKGRSLTINDAYDILSIPIVGIVYEDHDIIDSHNKGMPLYLNEHSITHSCFKKIVKRLNGEDVPFTRMKKRPLFERLFK
jgi:septum site-determining protein MinD